MTRPQKKRGLAVIEAGADVVAQHQDTPGPQRRKRKESWDWL